ncbi:MAG: N-acetylmuramoyl-L-alanine amidase [Lachnospiraceae bacterium]|nr:N-acetylmuramoyl-L-alanine amidase [Lachnospiraceae bacterium]
MNRNQKFYRFLFILLLFCFWGCMTSSVAKAKNTSYFRWETEVSEEQMADPEKNYLYKASAEKEEITSKTGVIHLFFTGTSYDLIRQVTLSEGKKEFLLTFPNAEYLPETKEFTDWKEFLSEMKVENTEDGSVTIHIVTTEEMDFSYTYEENTLDFRLFYDTTIVPPESYQKYALNILIPEGISIRDVSNEDLYEKKQFTITIKGNHVTFFKNNPIIKNSSKVKKVSVTKKSGNTVITVTTTSLQGYKIYEKKNFFVVKIGAPNKIYSSIVVLDAGHGGKDAGASAHGMKEKNLNYQIIYTMMKGYFSGNAPEIKVYWTRKTDTFITLAKRAAFAKKVKADVFISLHMNSALRKAANGTEVYYSVSNNKAGFDGLTSKKMAALFKKRLVNDLNMKDRGVKSAGFYVIKHNTVPAILIELGFISGTKDYKKLKKESFRKKAAKSIYVGIVQMFLNYTTDR